MAYPYRISHFAILPFANVVYQTADSWGLPSKCPGNPATKITGLRYSLAFTHTANYTQVKSDVIKHSYAAPPVFYVKSLCTVNCNQPVTEHAPVSQTTPIKTNYVLQYNESYNTSQLTKQYMVPVQ
jgi:hypothetical protein